MTKRNANIDFWKFIFAVLIVFHHSIFLRSGVRFFTGGAIGVEFFFLVSGYLMVDSFDRRGSSGNIARDTFDFMKRKAFPLFSAVLVSGLMGIFVKKTISHADAKEWIQTFADNVSYFLMIDLSGLRVPITANGVTWYLSAMLLSMLVLYPIMHKNKDLFLTVIAPLTSLFAFGYLYQNFDKLTNNTTEWLGLCCKGLVRGVAGICLGAICYVFAKKLRECRLTSSGRVFFSLTENLCYTVVFYVACTESPSKYDYILVLMLAVAVTCSFSGQTARYPFPDKMSALANFGFYLYLGNFFWALSALGRVFPTLSYWSVFTVYLVFTVVTALLIRYGSKMIERVWKAGVNLLITSEEPIAPLGGGGVALFGNEFNRKAFPLFGQGCCCAT